MSQRMYGRAAGSIEKRMESLIPWARDAWTIIQNGERSLEGLIESIRHNPPEGENEAFFRAYMALSLQQTAPLLFRGRNITEELGIDSIIGTKAEIDGLNHLVAVKMLDGTIYFVEGLSN